MSELLGWEAAKNWFDLNAAAGFLQQRLRSLLSRHDLEIAISLMLELELLEQNSTSFRLSEAERPEVELYNALHSHLLARELLSLIDVRGNDFVFQKTATGGTTGDGLLTRPDFTLAAIQSWRFDPQRSLEVFSFEVKNRAGANLSSVYEVVAHGRLVHHPYLVCPRSTLHPSKSQELADACIREGVGLLTFELQSLGKEGFAIRSMRMDARAERRSPDPATVERHLIARLSSENAAILGRLANGSGSV